MLQMAHHRPLLFDVADAITQRRTWQGERVLLVLPSFAARARRCAVALRCSAVVPVGCPCARLFLNPLFLL